MRRGLVHTLAWVLATGAAVALTWYGVHTVLTGTAYDPPRALTITDGSRSAAGNRSSSSTHRPKPPSPSKTSPSALVSPSREPSGRPRTSSAPKPKPTRPERPNPSGRPEAGGTVRSYPVRGGQVVFDIRDASADLVSATPAGGWQMQVWKQSQWIRVDFVSGADTTSVFCTWHDGPPRVRIDEP
jgi:hypothetical protein